MSVLSKNEKISDQISQILNNNKVFSGETSSSKDSAVKQFAVAIRSLQKNTLNEKIQIGELLREAWSHLRYSEYQQLITELDISASQISRFKTMAANKKWIVQHADKLPQNYGACYEFLKVKDLRFVSNELEKCFEAGKITPQMTTKQAIELCNVLKGTSPKEDDTIKFATVILPEGVNYKQRKFVRSTLNDAMKVINKEKGLHGVKITFTSSVNELAYDAKFPKEVTENIQQMKEQSVKFGMSSNNPYMQIIEAYEELTASETKQERVVALQKLQKIRKKEAPEISNKVGEVLHAIETGEVPKYLVEPVTQLPNVA